MNPYKNSYKIGDGTGGQHKPYTSVYKEEMVEKPIPPKEDNKRQSSMDFADSGKLGDGKFQGVTEFTDQ